MIQRLKAFAYLTQKTRKTTFIGGASNDPQNMLNLISSINNKYFDDIIIKDVKPKTPMVKR